MLRGFFISKCRPVYLIVKQAHHQMEANLYKNKMFF